MALDSLDRRLIASLKLDGRMSYAELAGRLDVSEGTVRNRLTKLLGSGTLAIRAGGRGRQDRLSPERVDWGAVPAGAMPGWWTNQAGAGSTRCGIRGLVPACTKRGVRGGVPVPGRDVALPRDRTAVGRDGITSVETSMVLDIAKTGWEWELREEDVRPVRRRVEGAFLEVITTPADITDTEIAERVSRLQAELRRLGLGAAICFGAHRDYYPADIRYLARWSCTDEETWYVCACRPRATPLSSQMRSRDLERARVEAYAGSVVLDRQPAETLAQLAREHGGRVGLSGLDGLRLQAST